LRLSENRVPRGIFGPKRDEVTGGWRKLHNEVLHGLYSSRKYYQGHEIKKDEKDEACSMHRETRNTYKISVGNLKGKVYSEDPSVDGRIILKWF
jgi:hypothetical protein